MTSSTMSSPSFIVIGSTGLVGSHILQTLLQTSSTSTITTLTRRDIKAELSSSSRLNKIIDKDTTKWPSLLTTAATNNNNTNTPTIMFSALGTTLHQTNNDKTKQYEIDHDLNLSVARAAKSAGVSTYVLISVSSANPNSWFHYPKMKGDIERDIQQVGFEKVVIVRPGMILGTREDTKGRFLEGVAQGTARFLGGIHSGLSSGWAQSSEMIAKAAVEAGLKAEVGTRFVEMGEIVSLGS